MSFHDRRILELAAGFSGTDQKNDFVVLQIAAVFAYYSAQTPGGIIHRSFAGHCRHV